MLGLLHFHSKGENIFAAHLKHSSFSPSADVKVMSNDLVVAMHLVSDRSQHNCTLWLLGGGTTNWYQRVVASAA